MRPVLAIAAAVTITAAASADTVDMRFTGTARGRAVSVGVGSDSLRIFAGQLNHEVVSRSSDNGPDVGALVTFCVDVLEHVSRNASTFDVGDLEHAPVNPAMAGMSQAKADAIGRLYTVAAGEQFGLSRDFAAAFQLAIWEVVNDLDDAGLDAADGHFRVTDGMTSGVRTTLDSLLAAATDAGVAVNRNLGSLTALGVQDQIYETAMIPLPATGGLAAVGLAGAGVLSRRRRH